MLSVSLRQPLRKRGPFDSLEQTSPGTHFQENLDDPIQLLLDHVSIPNLKALNKILETTCAEIDGCF